MATIVTCDRCGMAGAEAWYAGAFVLNAINDIVLPDEPDLCAECRDKLITLIRSWWWDVRESNAQASNAVPE